MTTTQTTIPKGQTVSCDMTGMGHNVIGTYEGAHPKGGHKVRLLHGGKMIRVQRTPVPCDGTLRKAEG